MRDPETQYSTRSRLTSLLPNLNVSQRSIDNLKNLLNRETLSDQTTAKSNSLFDNTGTRRIQDKQHVNKKRVFNRAYKE